MPPALKLLECLPDMANQVKLIVFLSTRYIMGALNWFSAKNSLLCPIQINGHHTPFG